MGVGWASEACPSVRPCLFTFLWSEMAKDADRERHAAKQNGGSELPDLGFGKYQKTPTRTWPGPSGGCMDVWRGLGLTPLFPVLDVGQEELLRGVVAGRRPGEATSRAPGGGGSPETQWPWRWVSCQETRSVPCGDDRD